MGPARTLQLRPEPLPVEGDLASTPFPVVLGWARANRTTGVLSINGEKFVFLLRGTPVHVESALADDTSEVYLKTRIPAATDESKLAEARATAQKTGHGVGEAMLGLGWLDPSELFEHKKAHAREKLISCFGPRSGAIRFEPRDSLGPDLVPIPLDVAEAMREALGRFYDRARLDRELPVDDLCRVSPAADVPETGVATEDARLLKLAAERPTLRALATAAGLRPDELKRRLYGLYCLGLVAFELGAPITEESPVERSMQHPFPVPKASGASAGWSSAPASPPSSVAPSFSAAPDAPPPPRPPTPRPPATFMRPATTTPHPPATTTPHPAATTPRPPGTTPRPPATPGPPTATARPAQATPRAPVTTPRPPTTTPRPVTAHDVRRDPSPAPAGKLTDEAARTVQDAIEAAELARANDEMADALEILRAADRALPNEPRILAELAFTLVLCDERKYAKEANRLAREARKAAPSLPLPYVVMGILLEQIKELDQATQMYKHALARDPDCSEASRRLGTITGSFKPTK